MLSGCRVLVMEDDALVAEGISEVLIEAEGVPVGPVPSVCEARELIKNDSSLDSALLNLNFRNGPVTPVLEPLNARGIPTVIYTRGAVPEDHRRCQPDLIALPKPMVPAWLTGEIPRVNAGPHLHLPANDPWAQTGSNPRTALGA